MSLQSHDELVDLSAALTAAAEARLRAIAAEEASVRADLAQLEERHRSARRLPGEALHALRGIGAEMLWQGWVARARRELQIRLARVLARKAMALRDLRRAHGRAEAAKALQAREKARLRRKGDRAQLQRDQEMMVLHEISLRRK